MSTVVFNKKLSSNFYLMKVNKTLNAKMGQFAMIRAWDKYPLLSRPISVYDEDGEGVTFLYKVVGEGTSIFSKLKSGDSVNVEGAYGTSFPILNGRILLVGGGVGIAPLYLAAKTLKNNSKDSVIDVLLGFTDEPLLLDEFSKVARDFKYQVGGFITDLVNDESYDYIYTCGPSIMMETLYKKIVNKDKLYASFESRMACGIGVCLACSCMTINGNKKLCTDGPIFLAKEVFNV